MPLWQHMHGRATALSTSSSTTATRPRGPDAQVNPDLHAGSRATTERRAHAGPAEPAAATAGPRRRRPRPAAARRRLAAAPRRGRRRGSTAAGLLPAINFIFSRAGCDAAVAAVPGRRPAADHARPERDGSARSSRSGARTSRTRIWRSSVTASGSTGLSAASPRTTPACCRRSRRSSRSCSPRGLVKAVFATETLALGINMPARTVVLERLVKWNGETHADITPGEYTQLTGRAGRRGIDVEGHAVVAVAARAGPRRGRRPGLDPHLSAAVELPPDVQHGGQPGRPGGPAERRASCWRRRSRSSRPTAAVVGLARQAQAQREALDGYAEAMRCHLGDFTE